MAEQNRSSLNPKMGEIYIVHFDGTGSVQTGSRPGVVFQNNAGNLYSPNIVMLPLTTNLRKMSMPTHVLLKACDTGLLKDSIVLCENPQCVSKDRIGRFITQLSRKYMAEIATASILASSAISFLDLDSIIDAWQKAINLNEAS